MLICRGCGCTDDRACPGSCSWISLDPPLCSNCLPIPDGQGADLAEGGGAADISGPAAPLDSTFFCDEVCQGSALPAFHAPVWTSNFGGHCARCREAFAA